MTLKQLRESRSMSQNDVARRLDVTVTTVYKWENGRAEPQPKYVRDLAELYSVSLDEIKSAIAESSK